jgi:hypothetical protein
LCFVRNCFLITKKLTITIDKIPIANKPYLINPEKKKVRNPWYLEFLVFSKIVGITVVVSNK